MKSSVELPDAVAIAGGVLIVVGAWLIYAPAALVIAGMLLIAGAALSVRH